MASDPAGIGSLVLNGIALMQFIQLLSIFRRWRRQRNGEGYVTRHEFTTAMATLAKKIEDRVDFQSNSIRSSRSVDLDHLAAYMPKRLQDTDTIAKKSILLIEDNPTDRALYTQVLSRVHNVTAVSTLREGLQLLRSARFDCVVLDLGLPDTIDGIDTMKLFRDRCPGAAAVVLSGNTDPRVIRGASEMGFATIFKDVETDFKDLEFKISAAILRHRNLAQP